MLVFRALTRDNKIPEKSCRFGKVVVGITGTTALGILPFTVSFVTPALRKNCLPYVPATERQVANIIKMAKTSKRQGLTRVDLDSGNGRVASFSLIIPYVGWVIGPLDDLVMGEPCVNPIHFYPDIFESATFLSRLKKVPIYT